MGAGGRLWWHGLEDVWGNGAGRDRRWLEGWTRWIEWEGSEVVLRVRDISEVGSSISARRGGHG